MGCRPVSSRLITIRLKASPFNITIIQAYAPTDYDGSDYELVMVTFRLRLHRVKNQGSIRIRFSPEKLKDLNIVEIRLMFSLPMSIFLYACETWTKAADIERIHALEMRCFRKLLGISYRDHITNEEVKARIGNAIGPYEDLLTSVKRGKLKWYGHITRSSGLAKTFLQGTVQGGRQRGRQRKRWQDNIKEWTGLEWNIILRKAENREEWRKLVVKSTVVPQRSARLRDR